MEDARNTDIYYLQGLEFTVYRSINIQVPNSDFAPQICFSLSLPHLNGDTPSSSQLLKAEIGKSSLFLSCPVPWFLFILPLKSIWNHLASVTTATLLAKLGPLQQPPTGPVFCFSSPAIHTAGRVTCENINRMPLLLKTLQWLPISHRIKYKLLALTPVDQQDLAPASLSQLSNTTLLLAGHVSLTLASLPSSPTKATTAQAQTVALLSLHPPAPQSQPNYGWCSGLRCHFLIQALPQPTLSEDPVLYPWLLFHL